MSCAHTPRRSKAVPTRKATVRLALPALPAVPEHPLLDHEAVHALVASLARVCASLEPPDLPGGRPGPDPDSVWADGDYTYIELELQDDDREIDLSVSGGHLFLRISQ